MAWRRSRKIQATVDSEKPGRELRERRSEIEPGEWGSVLKQVMRRSEERTTTWILKFFVASVLAVYLFVHIFVHLHILV